MSRAARDQSQQQLGGGRRRVFDDIRWANVLRLVRCGHSRAPFQSRAVSVGLEKAGKEMLRLMKSIAGDTAAKPSVLGTIFLFWNEAFQGRCYH